MLVQGLYPLKVKIQVDNRGVYTRRITATPLYFKAENWRLDMPGISVYPASIYSTPWISG
jgi:hypothetical protein